MNQAIDKRQTALSTKVFLHFDENNSVNFDPLTKNDLDIELNSLGDIIHSQCDAGNITFL